jgi:hypothetical protein
VRTTTAMVTLMLAVTSAACYQYFPVDDSAPLPDPGAEIRFRLDTPQPLDLGTMRISDINTVEGDVYEAEGDTLGVFSRQIYSAYGSKHFTNGAIFYFDRSQFRQLEQRRFVPWKSGVAIGAAAVGVAAVMYFALDLGSGAEGDGGGNGNPQAHKGISIPVGLLIPR